MNPKLRMQLLQERIDRLNSSWLKDSSRSIILGLFRLIHDFEQSFEAIDSAIRKLEQVAPAMGQILRQALADNGAVKTLIERLDQAALRVYDMNVDRDAKGDA